MTGKLDLERIFDELGDSRLGGGSCNSVERERENVFSQSSRFDRENICFLENEILELVDSILNGSNQDDE